VVRIFILPQDHKMKILWYNIGGIGTGWVQLTAGKDGVFAAAAYRVHAENIQWQVISQRNSIQQHCKVKYDTQFNIHRKHSQIWVKHSVNQIDKTLQETVSNDSKC